MNTSKETATWRSLLGDVIAVPEERQRLANILGVNQVSLTRWASGAFSPRPKNLHALLDALPQRREELYALITKEFPDVLNGLEAQEKREIAPEISSVFYDEIADLYRHLPTAIRTSALCTFILQHMLTHLSGQRSGLAVFIAQCTPPCSDSKIRSLRLTQGKGNPPWSDIEHTIAFFGLESQIGYACQVQRPIVIQRYEAVSQWSPTYDPLLEQSMVAYPLIQANTIAGCLVVISSQADYFSDVHVELIRKYSNLFLMAFHAAHFYAFEQITLGLLPSTSEQRPLLTGFQRRVTQYLIHAAQQGQSITQPEAELRLWRDTETLLLQSTSPPLHQPD